MSRRPASGGSELHRPLGSRVLVTPRREDVVREFDESAGWWDRVYRETSSASARVYRRRLDVALSWVDDLALPAGSRILEVGCGAGHTAVELARRGHHVTAIDGSQSMVDLARANARGAAVEDRLVVATGDAHRLDFPSASFDLVIALGVVAWLQEPFVAVGEWVRVTRPGGHVLVTSRNALDAGHLLDPKSNPLLRPVRTAVRSLKSATHRPVRPRPPQNRRYLHTSVRRMLGRRGLVPVREGAVGYWFTLLGKPVGGARSAMRVEQALQRRADSGGPVATALGQMYLVLARKPG